MVELPRYRRILLLTEGSLGVFRSKTAACMLRYRGEDVVGVLDSAAAGRDVRSFIPDAPPVPILPDVAAALPLKPDALFIGVAPTGGVLPEAMRRHVREALAAGIDVVSGLHVRLAADPEFAAATGRLKTGPTGRILDIRVPPTMLEVASGKAAGIRCRRVLTVGTDCNVGKMVAALEMARAAQRGGLDARFVATGQTGIMVAGRGLAVDAVVADFIAGAAERLVLAEADAEVCFIEGQGSIAHAGYSGVTLGLLHGAAPDALVLVHHAGRTHYHVEGSPPLPDIRSLCDAYERLAAFVYPARIAAVALNPSGASPDTVERERRRLERELGVPVANPVGEECEILLRALGLAGGNDCKS